MHRSKKTDTKKRGSKFHLLAGTDEEVTAPSQTTQSNVEIETSCKPGKDLAEASASHKEPNNRPRAMQSKAVKGKPQEQQQLTETASNAEEHQDAATANAADAPSPVEKVSSKSKRSKARKKAKQKKQQLHDSQQQQQEAPSSPSTGTAPNVERAEVPSQESIPSADTEKTLEQVSANLRQLESIIEQVRKQLSKVYGPLPPSARKVLKKQRSLVQVRGEDEVFRAAIASQSTRNAETEHPRESSQRQPQ